MDFKHSFSLDWSLSKVLAFYIVTLGSIYSFIFGHPEVITTGFTIGGGLVAVKTGATTFEKLSSNKNSQTVEGED